MTILLDENFPRRIVPFLEIRSHSIVDIRVTDREGIPDIALFDLGRSLKAAIFTTDRDFLTQIHRTHREHGGILIVTLARPNAESIVLETILFLDRIPVSEWSNRCYVLAGAGSCRIFS
jgi:predicted nuclease of predicted toxin-antitoxin system